ncbi:hypothetical protein NW752_009391 [Fusarium irregulare]|uniref:3-hydroxyisobutyrate dehydrogenase n=1 Tax=Fusarium irregulare TaxID=2494466 RepID=A0A9W8U4C5_9HYPO|nr:hypothetical protein NW766_012669 [Fusarium irregulare]KAJ4009096.1 hypothetical protein NW752_009391 [Fusarium irregulare]
MSSTNATRFGFIGLGQMGLPMASNLARHLSDADHLNVFDISTASMQQISNEFPATVSICSSAKDIAEKADVIFTMLPEGHHVKSVYLDGPNNILSADLSGKHLVECSTIDTEASMRMKKEALALYTTTHFYDAPVSGGVIGAVRGTLTFFVGCSHDDTNLPYLEQILHSMGKKVIPCGGFSLGLTSKICNNYLTGIMMLASAETFNLGIRAGLDPKLLRNVIGAGTAKNMICEAFCPVPNVVPGAPSSAGYKGGFRIPLMLKDLNLAMDLAQKVEAREDLGQVAQNVFDTASKDDQYKDLDIASVFKMIGGNVKWDQ